MDGKVEFQSVVFSYPTRSSVQVLSDLSLTINPGELVALVGSSGCGKTTSVHLIERFYDPVEGEVVSCSSNRGPRTLNVNVLLFG